MPRIPLPDYPPWPQNIQSAFRRRGARLFAAALARLHLLVLRLHRRILLRRHRAFAPEIPLVVVGALRLGGSGKTSVTIALARELKRRGFRVALLAYALKRARAKPPLFREVSDLSDWRDTSDEALLLRLETGCRVFVTRNRAKTWQTLQRELAGTVDLFLSDDGLQDPRLSAALRIRLQRTGEADPAPSDFFPAGPFRSLASLSGPFDWTLHGPVEGEPSGKVFSRQVRLEEIEAPEGRVLESRAPELPLRETPDPEQGAHETRGPEQGPRETPDPEQGARETWGPEDPAPEVSLLALQDLPPCFLVAGVGDPAFLIADLRQRGLRIAAFVTVENHGPLPADFRSRSGPYRHLPLVFTAKEKVKGMARCLPWPGGAYLLRQEVVLPEEFLADLIKRITLIAKGSRP